MTILRFLPAALAAAALCGAAPQLRAEMFAPTMPDAAPAPPKVDGSGNDELVIPADQSLGDALAPSKRAPATSLDAMPPAPRVETPYYDGAPQPKAENPAPPFNGSLQTSSSLGSYPVDAEGCEPCYECCICQPRCTAFGEAVFLHRSDPDDVGLVQTGGVTSFTARDIDFDYEPAWRTGILRRGNLADLELTFFGTAPWNETAAFNGNPSLFNAFGITQAGTQFNFGYDHDLYMAEANLWREVRPGISLMAGFRYAEVNEQLVVSGGGFSRLVDAATDNRLYGGQLGAKATVWCDPTGFQVDVMGKAGVYQNHADYRLASETVVPALSGSDERTAFLGDLSVVARYPVTDRLWLRGGFQLLFIDGLALAPGQSGSPNLATDVAIDANDSVFYHGGFVGLEMNW